jgi:hypothetical protein
MTQETTVKIQGAELDILYKYTPESGDGWNEEYIPAEVELLDVYPGSVETNLVDLLMEKNITDKIEDLIWTQMREGVA